MLNDKWIGEGIVRLLGRDGRAFVQGAVNQDVGTAGILPRISEKCRMQNEHSAPRRNQKGLASWLAQSRRERRGKQTQWRRAFHRKQRRTKKNSISSYLCALCVPLRQILLVAAGRAGFLEFFRGCLMRSILRPLGKLAGVRSRLPELTGGASFTACLHAQFSRH